MELFQPTHLLVLAIVAAVLFFGWKQMPDMARSLGRSLRVFKTEIKGLTEDDKARDQARDGAAADAQLPRPAIEAARVEPVRTEPVRAEVTRVDPAAPSLHKPQVVAAQPAGTRPRPAPRPARVPDDPAAR